MLLLKASVKLIFPDIPTVVTIDRIVAALCSELEALLLMQRRSTMEQSTLAARFFVSVRTATLALFRESRPEQLLALPALTQ